MLIALLICGIGKNWNLVNAIEFMKKGPKKECVLKL